MSVPTKIYYDSKDGFLWGEDAQGNLEKVKTDACVLMPENVRVDLNGHIIVQDLHGKDQLLRDLNDQIVSIKGPAGKNGRDGKDGRDVVCDYKTTDTVKFHKIVSQLNPGTYTIYGNVIGGIGDPFSSACLIIGLTNLALGYLPLIVNFGQKFQLATKQDISIVFVCYDYAKDMYDGNHTDWMVEALIDFTMSVENVYVCTHGDTPYINGSNWFVGGVDTGVAAQGPKGDKGDQGNTGDSVYALTTADEVVLTKHLTDYHSPLNQGPLHELLTWATNQCPADQGMSVALGLFVKDVLLSYHKAFIYDGYLFTFILNSQNNVDWLEYQSLKGDKGDKGDATTISSTNYANGVTTITFSDSTTVQINDGNQGIPGSLFVATNEPDQAFETGQMQLQMRAGDYSISNDTNTLWVCQTDGSFVKAGVLKGDLGPQGTSVTITKLDSSDPSKTLVIFSDGQSMTVYNGKDGKDGNDGQNGLPGANGTSIKLINSVSDLLQSQSQTGDSYILTKSDYDGDLGETMEEGSVYEFNGNVYSYKFSLKGPKGDKGADGTNGIDGLDGVDGIDGVDGSPGEGIHVLSESDIVLLSQYMSVTRDAVCQTLIDNIVQAEQIVSAGLYQFITNDYAYPETDPFILDGWLFKVVSTDGVSYVTQYIGQSLIGPQGAKGDQGDSYFTQPVADKLTAIAGEYDNVKQEVDDLRFDYDLLQGDYDSMKDMALPYIDKFKDLYDTYGDELTPLLQKCKDLFDKHKDEDLSDLLDRCKAKLELLDQIDLSGLAIAYPKDTTPEEA